MGLAVNATTLGTAIASLGIALFKSRKRGPAYAPAKLDKLFTQFRQRRADRIPNDFEINVEIAMGDAVPHAPRASPRNFAMRGGELAGP